MAVQIIKTNKKTGILLKLQNVLVSPVGKPNINGRIYTKEQLSSEVDSKQVLIDAGSFYGEYARDPRYVRDEMADTVNMKNVSHCITSLRITGDGLYANIDILNTHAGRKVAELLYRGFPINFCLSGTGDIDYGFNIRNYKMSQIYACFDKERGLYYRENLTW